jgi:TPR repeat protein
MEWPALSCLLLVLFLSLHYLVGQELESTILSMGRAQGIDQSSHISAETLQKILHGAENGNKDNIYFYGLLKLYGLAVAKDTAGALQQFRRASSLGHLEATTACGVMLMTSATSTASTSGGVQYTEAVRYFREAVAGGDLVRLVVTN